jgi:RimJ/RimL family protein N-acetyltransferase
MPQRRLVDVDLCGERVRLRLHRAEDAAAAFALLEGQDEILRWLVWEGPSSPLDLAEYYRRGAHLDGALDLHLAIEERALEERASGALIGSLSLRFTGHPGQGDVGYWIGVPFQGRGFGREALALTAHLAFRYLGAQALQAWVFVGNVASRRVLEHSGFTLTRTVPGRIVKRGRRVDEWHFVLLSSEWRRLAVGVTPTSEKVAWRVERERGEPGADELEFPA